MARQAKLRKKKVGKCVYWFTKAGGETYFANVEEVSHKDAKKAFGEHLLRIADGSAASKRAALTAGELMDLFLDWVQKNRSEKNYDTRRRYCSRFGKCEVGGRKGRVADLPADQVRGEDLEAWLARLEGEEGLGPQTRLHAETSVRHAWTWGTKHPSPTPHLPPTFRPFSAVERTHVPPKTLAEADLVTDAEITAVITAASFEPNQFRRHGLEKTVARKGVGGLRRTDGRVGCLADMLRCYYATGARTDELASCQVADVQFRPRQITLGNHKRSKTERKQTTRQVTLNDEAMAIVSRHCEGRSPGDPVFVNNDGRPWTVHALDRRFARVKEVASALKLGEVRPEITIYDFRHLWISEMVQADGNVARVARMAGTSIAMIERVYGHFRNQDLHEAQARLDEARKRRGR